MKIEMQRISPCRPDPIEGIEFDPMDDIMTRALRDARQTRDQALQQEALAWLWVCCPDIADELQLPTPAPAATPKQGQPAALDYLQRYAAFSLA